MIAVNINFFIIKLCQQISLSFHFYFENMDFTFLISISDGDEQFISDFISTYESSVLTNIDKLKDAFDTKDFVMMQKLAHQIKPTTEMLGFDSQSDIVAINKNSNSTSSEQIAKIIKEAQQVLAVLKSTFQS